MGWVIFLTKFFLFKQIVGMSTMGLLLMQQCAALRHVPEIFNMLAICTTQIQAQLNIHVPRLFKNKAMLSTVIITEKLVQAMELFLQVSKVSQWLNALMLIRHLFPAGVQVWYWRRLEYAVHHRYLAHRMNRQLRQICIILHHRQPANLLFLMQKQTMAATIIG